MCVLLFSEFIELKSVQLYEEKKLEVSESIFKLINYKNLVNRV